MSCDPIHTFLHINQFSTSHAGIFFNTVIVAKLYYFQNSLIECIEFNGSV